MKGNDPMTLFKTLLSLSLPLLFAGVLFAEEGGGNAPDMPPAPSPGPNGGAEEIPFSASVGTAALGTGLVTLGVAATGAIVGTGATVAVLAKKRARESADNKFAALQAKGKEEAAEKVTYNIKQFDAPTIDHLREQNENTKFADSHKETQTSELESAGNHAGTITNQGNKEHNFKSPGVRREDINYLENPVSGQAKDFSKSHWTRSKTPKIQKNKTRGYP
jgi:hypothetical protein